MDLAAGTAVIHRGKGGKARRVPFGPRELVGVVAAEAASANAFNAADAELLAHATARLASVVEMARAIEPGFLRKRAS